MDEIRRLNGDPHFSEDYNETDRSAQAFYDYFYDDDEGGER